MRPGSIVQADNLAPIRRVDARGVRMYCGNGRLEGIGARPPHAQGSFHQGSPLRDQIRVPEGAALVIEQDQLAVWRGARPAPRCVEQHQGQQAHHFRLWHQVQAQPPRRIAFPDRSGRVSVAPELAE